MANTDPLFWLQESNLSVVCSRNKYGIKWGRDYMLEPQYTKINAGKYTEVFTLHHPLLGECVVDREFRTIIPYGRYRYISGVYRGFAKVRRDGKYGIINMKGEEVVPPIYDEVWGFYNTSYNRPTLRKDNVEYRFDMDTGRVFNTNKPLYEHHCIDHTKLYGQHFREPEMKK